MSVNEILMPELAGRVMDKVSQTSDKWYYKLIRLVLFGIRSQFFDVRYKTITIYELEQALNEFWEWLEEHEKDYQNEFFDCDDFALAFKVFMSMRYNTNAVGVAIGIVKDENGNILGGHAWNIAVLTNKTIVFIEPQTKEVFIENRTRDGWKYELISVLW